MNSSRSDAEHSHGRFMDDLEGLEVTEELSGFNSDNEEHRGHMNVGDTMSDIGHVVSQTEAGMDFTTNLEAPMEGVQRRAGASARSSVSGRPIRGGAGLGLVNGKPSPYEDMSMSRLADSYWRPGNESSSENAHEFTRDDLGTMEFTTNQSAVAASVSQSRGGEEGETASDSFLVHANGGSSQHQHRLGSFYSDSHYQQQQQRPISAESGGSRPLPRRPESYHDGPSTSSHQQQPLPTFSSTNDSRSGAAAVQSETTNDRLARLVARYSGDPQQRMAAANNGVYGAGIRDMSSEALSDDGMLPALPDTPDVHTAFTSIGHFSSMHSDTPPVNNGRMALDPSIVERTRTALQQRIATSESPEKPVDGPSYSEMRQRFLGGSGGSQQQFAGHRRAADVGDRSMESLDHPNLGSQGSRSPGRSSILSMADGGETGYYNNNHDDDHARFMRPMDGESEEEEEFGARRINSFGLSSDDDNRGRVRETRLSDQFDSSYNHGATGEQFNPVEDADELFGDHYTSSSNPDFSDIVRDHERVFSDLFDSSDSDNEGPGGPHDSTEAPASLFASSSSIVAEISRRQAQGMRKKGKLSTWDGREATPDAMRRQEQMFGVHARNPIEMQGKINSLGLEDQASDVSGLLPESEHSPRTMPRAGNERVRSNTGVSLAQLGRAYRPPLADVSAFPITPQSAPMQGSAFDALPPPTTPTTFISRDTRHGPSTRVLHQVPPFEPISPPNGVQYGQQEPTPATLRFRDENKGVAPQRRPAGPRSIDQSIGRSNAGSVKSRPPMLDIVRQTTPDQRRNARAAAQFAQAAAASSSQEPNVSKQPVSNTGGAASPSDVSSHGLGSLFMDSLPVLEASRVGQAGTPPAPFHALSRILNNGHTPRSPAPYSPLRSAHGISSGNSSMLNTNGYVPFQDPTVDISNLPKYQDVDLKRQSPNVFRQQVPPDSAVTNLYSATPSETRDAPSRGSFGFQSRRRVSPWSHAQSHGDSGSDLVPTVKYDSPTASGHSLESLSLSDIGMEDEEASVSERNMRPPHLNMRPGSHRTSHATAPGSVREGPTLRDIYDLLKKTVSSIDAQQRQTPPVHEELADGMSAMNFGEDTVADKFGTGSMHVPRQLQSQAQEWDYRPAAPTPRRSRHFPTQYRDEDMRSESEEGGMVDESRGRSDAGQSRVRAYLQRYISESAIGQSYASGHNPIPSRGSAPPALSIGPKEEVNEDSGEAEKILVDLLSFVSGGGGAAAVSDADLDSVLGRKLPPALADKLRELARVLAQATAKEKQPVVAPVVDEAVQTEAPVVKEQEEGLRVELLRLQREILDKFDEYRAEVDQLRSEVRRGSLPHQSPSSVAPHDSVSVVAAKRMLTPTSPRPASSVRPMYTVPTTARNRQRHMVQWLGQQSGDVEDGTMPFTTPTKRGPSRSVMESPLNGSSRRSSARRRAEVEDVDDDAGLGTPKRMSDDDELSDTSTTVPDRLPMALRSPVDPATMMRHTPGRTMRHKAVSPWDGHEDLLATREALDSIRGKRQKQADDDFGHEVYGREMAQQLGDTLAELQRVHAAQFHSQRLLAPCPVCRALEAQNHDPYLFGRRAVAYRSMSTRQLQGLLNAYVAAMQDQVPAEEEKKPLVRTSFTPTRAKAPAVVKKKEKDPSAAKVIGLLRDELDALSRRYHRLVDEFHRLDPSRAGDQRRRRMMSKELKDLVDVLDGKGEQIAILASLHPDVVTVQEDVKRPRELSSAQRALLSARELQNALGDLY
ncbi:hypothetical protein H4R27_004074 [Coemansia aciculifera]|nr:hypothetical protein H4R27_004074 [Coemansia aciculifera]